MLHGVYARMWAKLAKFMQQWEVVPLIPCTLLVSSKLAQPPLHSLPPPVQSGVAHECFCLTFVRPTSAGNDSLCVGEQLEGVARHTRVELEATSVSCHYYRQCPKQGLLVHISSMHLEQHPSQFRSGWW